MNNVTKLYGKGKGIKDINLELEKGNVYGLIGPNGAGKTTLIKVLTNFILKDSGEVLKDFDKNDMLNNISYLPEFNLLIPGTVKKNIDFFTMTYEDCNIEKLHKILDTFEISMKDNVRSLSTGKSKALRFALCVCRDVKVYILDEPFSGIDVITRKKIVTEILQEVDIEESVVLVSSHELHDMDSLLDYVLLMNGAELRNIKKVEDIKREANQSLYEWYVSELS